MENWDIFYNEVKNSLVNFYRYNTDNPSKALYDKLKNSDFFEINKNRLARDEQKNLGLDPIQIFALFNYPNIKIERRIKCINSLFVELGSSLKINTDEIEFEGCPTPIITKIVEYRGFEFQNEIWHTFANISENGFDGLKESHFKLMERWHGVDYVSFTIFLFWIDSSSFLPLDQNTTKFLRAFDLIKNNPRSFYDYVELCKKIKEKRKEIIQNEIFKNIVKDSYRFAKENYIGDILSGTTVSILSNNLDEEIQVKQEEAKIKQKENLNNFKLLAIRPKANKSNPYLKNIVPGELYRFYDIFEFSENDKEIIYKRDQDLNIYNSENLKISISAIVGKNGSGKSTLIELFYLVVNRIAFLKEIESTEKLKDELVFADIFILTDKLYRISVGNDVEIHKYIHESKTDVFTLDEKINDWKLDFEFDSFCYSLVLNYSLYGLNTKIQGDWLDPLFHKNDSYQVPIVLNPKRTDGNIDVNIEEDLARSRTLSNIFDPQRLIYNEDTIEVFELVPNARPLKLNISINEEKLKRKREMFRRIYREHIKAENVEKVFDLLGIVPNNNTLFAEDCKEYIYLKLLSIPASYTKYYKYKKLPHTVQENIELWKKYINEIIKESSHITFKLRQAINYIKFNLFTKVEDLVLDLVIKIRDFKEDESKRGIEHRIIDLILPSFLDFDITFKHGGTFKGLSSGEKQKIYSVNTISYHIFNIDSVMPSLKDLKYSNINIVFDEVELYFHPEMQRTFINDLWKQLVDLELTHVNNINIVFLTHSPFILSDIPNSNILKLEKGENRNNVSIGKTFGANIYDLLANDFFMNNGFIGEFAMSKIKDILDYVGEETYIPEKHNYYLQIANLIADDAIRIKLEQLLSSLYEDPNNELEKLKSQQKEIEVQIKKLEKK